MWDNTVSPVERATAFVPCNKCDERDCFYERIKIKRKIPGRAQKWELTSNVNVLLCVYNQYSSSGIKFSIKIRIIIIISPGIEASS
jgi:hypothetical protein